MSNGRQCELRDDQDADEGDGDPHGRVFMHQEGVADSEHHAVQRE